MRPLGGKPRGAAEALIIPAGALAVSLILFGIFVAFAGANPLAVYRTIYRGAFGSWLSWQNTLQRAAPLMLTALCTALPAQVGLIVIGGEGALIIGAVATVALAAVLPGVPPPAVVAAMLLAGVGAGRLRIALPGRLRPHLGPDGAHRVRIRRARGGRKHPRSPHRGAIGGAARADHLLHRGGGRRARRHDGDCRRARPGQLLARRRLRLYRHSRRLPRPPEPTGGDPGGDPARRH